MTSPTASPARNLPGKSRSRSPPPLPPAVMHPALAVLLRGRKAILFPIGELDRDRGAGAQVPPWPSSRDLKRRLDALEAECSAALDADPPPPNLPLAGIIEGAVAQLRDSIEALAGYEAVVDRATSRQGFATAVQAQLQAPTPPATATPPQNQSSKDTQRTQTGKRARVSDEVKEEVLIKAESPSQPPSKRARIKPAADIPRSDLGSVIDESVRPASAPPRSRGRRTLIKVEAEALPSPLELPKSGSASRQRREPVQAPSSDIPSSPLLKKSHAPIQTEEKTARAASPASSISVASVTSKGLPFPKEATDILNAWLEEHM